MPKICLKPRSKATLLTPSNPLKITVLKVYRLTHNAERTRGNCIAVDVAAAEGRKCRDLLAESPDKGNAKNLTTPHVQF